MQERIVITAKGEIALREELRRLKAEDRPAVIAAIAEARAHGDLSENAEYHAAREQQSFIEARIKQLDASLSIAEIIDPTKIYVAGKVVFGVRVELYDIEKEEIVNYQLVGNLEADLSKGRISIASPIGKAMLGKNVGDEIEVRAPGGKRSYEILDVSCG